MKPTQKVPKKRIRIKSDHVLRVKKIRKGDLFVLDFFQVKKVKKIEKKMKIIVPKKFKKKLKNSLRKCST